MTRCLGPLACVCLAFSLAGCGGGDDEQTSETDVRECLAGEGMSLQRTDSTGSGLTGYAPIYVPDFTVRSKDGNSVAILVVANDERARREAAHVRSAIASVSGSEATVVSAGNAVAVFAGAPAQADRDAVRACLGA